MPNILIADDHDLVRDTIAAYLETVEGFKVFTAENLDAAMKVMAGLDPIDLLILDYNMPGMNGLDGLERAQKGYPSTKVALTLSKMHLYPWSQICETFISGRVTLAD